jgi:uncharacterized cupredoxin-like copper-binding protein
MNLKGRFWLAGIALMSAIILSACGGTGDTGSSAGTTVNTLDTLKFDPAAITVASGSTVAVKNSGIQDHNFVVVAAADEARVAEEALAKGGDATGLSGVLAGGPILKAGASENVTISIPAGTYRYICTVAGHYQAGMVGDLTVN